MAFVPCVMSHIVLLLGLVSWQSWSEQLFARAKAENKMVLLDLGAVWCHWCHVMEETTYADPDVARLLGEKFIAVKADQDADPDLSRRYENYGWPATIIFGPDGKELIKRRGYLPPVTMISLLKELIDDPTPGPSVRPERPWMPSKGPRLQAPERAALEKRFAEIYDRKHGGWGSVHRFLDAEPLEYALSDARFHPWARKTLDNTLHLLDPVWGGIYQYSDTLDWSSPHYEKIMSFQASAMRVYVAAYQRFGKRAYLDAALGIARYITTFLSSPEGAFHVSQDADLSHQVPGKTYYALDATRRRALGLPKVDTHVYPRENGWAIGALADLYAATKDRAWLERARKAAISMETARKLPDGAFRHGETDRAGPYLGDTLAMAEAYERLHAAGGDATHREHALESLRALDARFRHGESGYFTAPVEKGATGVFAKPVRIVEENIAVARLALRLGQREIADRALAYLASPTLPEERPFSPGVLLADRERSSVK
jgi:uncharacterized protein